MFSFDCPICRKRIRVPRRDDALFRPFCSYRCKMVDLGRWLDGSYAISEPLKPEDLDQPLASADTQTDEE